MGARPVVLVHGFMQAGSEWDQVSSLLAGQFAIHTPTLSAPCPEQASLDALARQLAYACEQAIEAAGGSTCAVVGYSMGGRVALQLAQSRPELVDALVLESAGLGPVDQAEREAMRQRTMQMVERLRCDGLANFVNWWQELPLFATQKDLPAEVQQQIRSGRLACNPDELALLLEHAGAHTMPDAATALEMLATAPYSVLYLAGVRDAKYAQVAAGLPANVQVRLLDAGHNVHRELPEAYAHILGEFLG